MENSINPETLRPEQTPLGGGTALSVNHFRLPSGVHPSFTGGFNPDVGLEDIQLDWIDIDEVNESANSFLRRYGYEPITPEDLNVQVQSIDSEVGDDEEHLGNSKAFVGYLWYFHRKFMMKESVEDTCLNPRYGNFAEDLIILPDKFYQTYHNARNTSGTQDMSFIDIPKLRLAIDIRPMRMNHSSTNDGKAQMLGSRLAWMPITSPVRGIYEVFNLYQDINLGLIRDKKFPYLPTQLGGYGKPLPFSNAKNFERFLKAYKQGTHAPLVRNIIIRTNRFLSSLETGFYPEKDRLLSHVVRFQSSFHDWIKGKSIYCPLTWVDMPQGLQGFQAGKLGLSRQTDEVISRLISEKRLVTETQLEIAVEHNQLCEALVNPRTTIPEFRKIIQEKRKEWSNLSLFSLQSYKMIEEIHLEQSYTLRKLRDVEVLRFISLTRDRRYNLKALLRDEYVYWPGAMDEIYRRGPMNVRFTMTPINKVSTRSFAAQTIDYRANTEDTEMIGAIEAMETWLRNGAVGPAPRILVNGDESIIVEHSNNQASVIVTDDIKLCERANLKTGCPVFRCPVEWYYRSLYFGEGGSPWLSFISEKFPSVEWKEIQDPGSIQSFEEKRFFNGAMAKRRIKQPFSMFKGLREKDPVIFEESEDYSEEAPSNWSSCLYDRKNLLRNRRMARYNYLDRPSLAR